MDALVWLSEGEGMPHVLAEAAAAGLPAVVTRDNGSEQQVVDGESGLFVPARDPGPWPKRWCASWTTVRGCAGVEERYSAAVVVPHWRTLLDELVPDRSGGM